MNAIPRFPRIQFPLAITEVTTSGPKISSSTKILSMPLSSSCFPQQAITTFSKWKPPNPRKMFPNLSGFSNWSSFAMR